MKKISLLVSTTDNNLLKNKTFFNNIDFEICEVIIVQQLIYSEEKLVLDEDVKLVSVKEKGLSKSRNRAITLATTKYALICDDDINFIKGFEQVILSAFEKYNNAALLSFKIEDENGEAYKTYPQQSFKHDFRSIMRVNSIEMALNLNCFENKKIYDENFGLGAACPTGEDTILSVEIYKSNKPCYFINESIVIHPLESSGSNFHDKYPFHRGQLYRRAFGPIGIIFGLIFSMKKYKLYSSNYSIVFFVKEFMKGYFTKVF